MCHVHHGWVLANEAVWTEKRSAVPVATRGYVGGRVKCSWCVFFFSSRRRHTRLQGDWSSDVCSSDLLAGRCLCTRRRPPRGAGGGEALRGHDAPRAPPGDRGRTLSRAPGHRPGVREGDRESVV